MKMYASRVAEIVNKFNENLKKCTGDQKVVFYASKSPDDENKDKNGVSETDESHAGVEQPGDSSKELGGVHCEKVGKCSSVG